MISKNKAKKNKIETKWESLKNLGYFDSARDDEMKAQYYKPLFAILTNQEKDFITGKTKIGALVPKPEIYACLAQLRKANYKHSRRRPILFDWIDRRPNGSLKCLYTNLVLDQTEDEWTILTENGDEETPSNSKPSKFDEEHTFPQSFQSGTKLGTGRDLHQIFAVSKSANGKRGNKIFGVGQTIKKQNDFGVFSKTNKHKFYEPKQNKSVAARGFLYVMQGYPGCVASDRFPRGSEDWVREFGSLENVSFWEKHRNFCIHLLQGNRNPFVDFPRLVHLVDFACAWRG